MKNQWFIYFYCLVLSLILNKNDQAVLLRHGHLKKIPAPSISEISVPNVAGIEIRSMPIHMMNILTKLRTLISEI